MTPVDASVQPRVAPDTSGLAASTTCANDPVMEPKSKGLIIIRD